MIPVYKGQSLNELDPKMKAFALALEDLINEHKRNGLNPSGVLNILANAYANTGRACEVDPALLKDLATTCVDHTQKFDPSTFYKDPSK